MTAGRSPHDVPGNVAVRATHALRQEAATRDELEAWTSRTTTSFVRMDERATPPFGPFAHVHANGSPGDAVAAASSPSGHAEKCTDAGWPPYDPPMAPGRSPLRGYAAALVCAVMAGSAYTVFKRVDPGVPRFTSLAWMSIVATAVFYLLRALGGSPAPPRLGRPEWRILLIQTSLTFFGIWGIWAGVVRLDPAVASFLGRTESLFSLLAALLLLGERFRRSEVPGVALAVLGVGILLQDGLARANARVFGEGAALMLGGAAVMGLSELWSKKAMARVRPLDFALLRAALLTLAYLVVGAITGDLIVPGTRDLAFVTLAALLAPAGARLFFLTSLRSLDLSKAVTLNLTQPLFAGALALVWLGTSPPPVQWAGGLLALTGCGALVLARFRRARGRRDAESGRSGSPSA